MICEYGPLRGHGFDMGMNFGNRPHAHQFHNMIFGNGRCEGRGVHLIPDTLYGEPLCRQTDRYHTLLAHTFATRVC